MLLERRGVDRDLGLARRPVLREAQVRDRGAVQVVHGTGGEVFGRDPLVVPLGEREEEPGLVWRHPFHRVLAEVLDNSLAIIGRHRFHDSLLPRHRKGAPPWTCLGSLR